MNHIYLAIFLVSCSALAFQVSLVRLFSIYLWYHFAFMVISIAMLGIGSGGTLLSVFPKLKRASNMAAYAMLLGIAIIAGYIFSNYIPFDPVKLSWDRVQLVYIALYYVALAAPFFFSGLIIATALSNISEKSGLLYGSDLLGAGFGSLMVLGLLNIAGPEYAILIASTLAFISAFVIGEKKVKVFSIVLITINLCIILIHPDFINVRISPYKSLSLSLKYPGAEHLKTYHSPFSRIDTLKSPAVRFAPGLSLRYLEPLPEQIGFSIDGGEMNAITRAKDKESLRFLEFLPSALCYEIGKRDDVLIIEPKGGLQALMAEYYGSKEIHKVENNPVVIKIIQNEFSKFSGKIFEKDTWTGLGRSYLINKNVKYDIIDLPMTGTSTAASFGISEDYRFTVEAFQEYLNHLKEDGLMSISLYLIPPPRIELRLLTTIATALEERGVKDVSSHIAAIRSWGSIIILVKNSPITLKEINGIKDFSKDRRFDLIHYPEIKDEETNIYVKMPSNEYFTAFKNILNPETRRLFIKDYLFDITPVHDENPFFHYYLRLKNIKAIYEVMGGKWQYFIEEGYLLPL
ncbi:MAG: hypothetical protein HZC12_04730 [Nitrospirae bacterium]|nr:hypothetical protein [Nitrospirota bacterium]